jgi:hypothetical protein
VTNSPKGFRMNVESLVSGGDGKAISTQSAGPRPLFRSATAQSYWYVKARHTQTGAEVQRISMADGANTVADATVEMKRYLLRSGRAGADIDLWDIVDASRWPRLRSAHDG